MRLLGAKLAERSMTDSPTSMRAWCGKNPSGFFILSTAHPHTEAAAKVYVVRASGWSTWEECASRGWTVVPVEIKEMTDGE